VNPVSLSLSPDLPLALFASDGSASPLLRGGPTCLTRWRDVAELQSRHNFLDACHRFLEGLQTELGGYSRD
jgi:hypothetical protein